MDDTGGDSFRSRVSDNSMCSGRSGFYREKENIPTNKFLSTLRKRFDAADSDHKGSLTFEEWRSSNLRPLIQNGNLSQYQFEQYFLRIDANSDEKVTWDELCQYLLQEGTTDKLVTDSGNQLNFIKTVQCPFERNSMHREICTFATISEKTEELITLSIDSIHFWSIKNLSHRRSLQEPGQFIGLIVFDLQGLIVVLTSTRRMLFYDLTTLLQFPIEINASPSRQTIKKMNMKQADLAIHSLSNTNMPLFNIPTAIHPYDTNDADMHFFVGDDVGVIEAFCITAPKRRQASDFTVYRVSFRAMHKKRVTCIKSISCKKMYASSSDDGTIIVWTWEPLTHQFKTVMKLVDNIPITFFYFNEKQKVFVSCNHTRDAWIWSFTSGKKTFKLSGHTSAVIYAGDFNGTSGEQFILTMSIKKEFFLWDAVNYRPLRDWIESTVQRPENIFGAGFIDAKRNSFYSISSVPSEWKEDIAAALNMPRNTTSVHKIISTVFSPIFSQVITIDAVGNFTVWDMKTGNMMVKRYQRSTGSSKEIVAADIDQLGRRIVIGTEEGSIGIWNFNNAALIQTIEYRETNSPVAMVKTGYINGRPILLRVQSDSTISTFTEYERGEFDFLKWYTQQNMVITGVAMMTTGFVSSFADGQLIFWKVDSSSPVYKTFTPSDSCECIAILSLYLICTDLRGNIFIYLLPKLVMQESITNAHQIYTQYSIIAIECDEERQLIYTADSLGYIRKWSLKTTPRVTLEPISFIRGSMKEITILKLINNGKFLLATSLDLCTRMWDTEEMKLVGHFSEKAKWNTSDPETWAGDSPFQIDPIHTTRVEKAQKGKQLASIRNFRSMWSFKDLLCEASSRGVVDKEDNKEEEEEYKPVDFGRIGKMFAEFTLEPPITIDDTVLSDHERDSTIAKTFVTRDIDITQTRPNELMEQIDALLRPKAKKEETGSRLRTAKLIRPLTIPPFRQPRTRKSSMFK